MKQSINVWGIKEFEGDGVSCPIIPINLPWYKKVALTFFRFGICPLCVTMSLSYSIGKFFKNLFGINKNQKSFLIQKKAVINIGFFSILFTISSV